jgi:phosphoglycolate phosphatase
MTRPIAVFDLDGTLVDTAPDLLAALNTVLEGEGIAPVAAEIGRRMIGHGAKAMIAGALRHYGLPVTDERIAPMYTRFLDYYRANIAVKSRPFPGTVAALDRLLEQDVILAVCTNKLEDLSRSLLDELALSSRFSAVAGQDTFGVSKPDPAHLLGTIARAGGSADRAVMVGDSILDMLAARRAGVTAIAVPFGYSDKPVDELGADLVITHFNELYAAAAIPLGLSETAAAP